jgi:hypothetical protein
VRCSPAIGVDGTLSFELGDYKCCAIKTYKASLVQSGERTFAQHFQHTESSTVIACKVELKLHLAAGKKRRIQRPDENVVHLQTAC